MPRSAHEALTVEIDPPPRRWADLSARRAEGETLGRSLAEWRDLTRRELFGESFSRILGTGHQAQFWHPGILAKFEALDAAAEAFDADATVEVVVDVDINDPGLILVPAHTADEQLVTVEARCIPPPEHLNVPTGLRPATAVEAEPLHPDALRPALPSIAEGWLRMLDALHAQCEAMSVAEQFARATSLLRRSAAQPLTPSPTHPLILPASRLTQSTVWRALIEHIASDPRATFDSYNTAVARHPDAGVAVLHVERGRCEMPLWVIESNGIRRRCYEDDLQLPPPRPSPAEPGEGVRDPLPTLWPRALLVTGLLRLAVCDLFIHGRSGAIYDRITDDWFAALLGVELAPFVMTTATLTLDFGRKSFHPADLARARWLAHSLRYNVDRRLEDPSLWRRRESLLHGIKNAPRNSPQRRRLFDEMRTLQAEATEIGARDIAQADAAVTRLQRAGAEQPVIHERRWPFPFHERAALESLREEVRRCIGGM